MISRRLLRCDAWPNHSVATGMHAELKVPQGACSMSVRLMHCISYLGSEDAAGVRVVQRPGQLL
jgi:hypothetical protein